jgi:hypothetical protein
VPDVAKLERYAGYRPRTPLVRIVADIVADIVAEQRAAFRAWDAPLQDCQAC